MRRLVLMCMITCVAACASTDSRFRTFAYLQPVDGVPVACGATLVPFPLRGVLAGDAQDPQELTWLLSSDDGHRISVVWPAGFSVRFSPDAVIFDELGKAVASAGDVIQLPGVTTGSHAGTYADPYLTADALFQGCYVPVATAGG